MCAHGFVQGRVRLPALLVLLAVASQLLQQPRQHRAGVSLAVQFLQVIGDYKTATLIDWLTDLMKVILR